MSDPFHSSKYSLARAKQHISDLERQVSEFIKTKPYTFVVEIDPNTSEEVHKVKLTKPVPVALPGIALDAANNLRSALDQAIYAVILLATGKKVKNAFFPVARTEADFENAVRGRLKELPKEIVDLIRALKPYKGGNIPLWVLNVFCNTNKHAAIAPVIITRGGRMRARGVAAPGFTMPFPVWDGTKNEMELFRQPVGSASNVEIEITYHVAVSDVELMENAPIGLVFDKFLSVVEGIVMALEAEAQRLGLI